MLVRFNYRVNPLHVVWVDPALVFSVETHDAGGTDLVMKNGAQFILHQGPDEVAAVVNGASTGVGNVLGK